MAGFVAGFGADEDFRFVIVEFEDDSLHSAFYICEAVCEGRVSGGSKNIW